MKLRDIREKINIAIYDSKETVLKLFRVSSIVVTLIAVFAMLYFHGFDISNSHKHIITLVLKGAFGFFTLKYFARIFFSFSPLTDFKESIFEGTLISLILINGILAFFFDFHLLQSIGLTLGFNNVTRFVAIVIQCYFLLLLLNEIGRAGSRISNLNFSPPTLLISSFLILIVVGCGLLMLPEMSNPKGSMPFFESLFTSISASCVTGLTVVDTATYFTFKGQLVVMLLIQMGGLNIISFASIFALIARRGMGIKHQSILQENLNAESLSASSSLFRQIFVFSLSIELIGAALIFLFWSDSTHFHTLGDQFFYALFHSISAFNNAGFSTLSQGMFSTGVQHSYALHLVIALLIVLGSLGFATLRDLFSPQLLRERKQKSWKGLRIDSKISLYSAAILIGAGTIIFLLFENNNSLAEHSAFGKFTTALFQSVTTRTAGFNTVDIATLSAPVLIFTIFLMFIGAAPGSTGGGIKTSTFTLVFLGAWSTTRGKSRLELFRSTIPFELLNKAFLILLFSLSFISLGIFGLVIVEPDKDLLALSFEEVSAFSTVGLSTGITSQLSMPGKVIIMLSMFIGRIGTLSLAFALGLKQKSNDYKYPKANILVG